MAGLTTFSFNISTPNGLTARQEQYILERIDEALENLGLEADVESQVKLWPDD